MKLFKKVLFRYYLAALFLAVAYVIYSGYKLIKSFRKPINSYEKVYPEDYINWDDGRI